MLDWWRRAMPFLMPLHALQAPKTLTMASIVSLECSIAITYVPFHLPLPLISIRYTKSPINWVNISTMEVRVETRLPLATLVQRQAPLVISTTIHKLLLETYSSLISNTYNTCSNNHISLATGTASVTYLTIFCNHWMVWRTSDLIPRSLVTMLTVVNLLGVSAISNMEIICKEFQIMEMYHQANSLSHLVMLPNKIM